MRVAAALSFTTVLALVPLVTVIFSMLSLFPVFATWTHSLELFVFTHFVPAAGDAVRQYISEFSAQAGKLTAVGLGLLLSSLLLLVTIESAFNNIWHVRQGRNWLQCLITYWAVISLGPLLSDRLLPADVTRLIFRYLPLVLELLAFMLFYFAIPNAKIQLRHAFAGSVTATAAFELAKSGFALYILNFNSYQLIYGALSTIPIFLLWVYRSWIVLLLGALVAAVLGARTPPATAPSAA